MVIKVARHKGNIDVAAFADGLAVVHGLEHGEAARVLLHQARKRIEISRALMATECLPGRKCLARGCDGSVHIVDIALGDFGESFAVGGIAGGLILAAQGLYPCAANEFLKPAMMPLK